MCVPGPHSRWPHVTAWTARRSHAKSPWTSWGPRVGFLVEGFSWTGLHYFCVCSSLLLQLAREFGATVAFEG
eukprot:1601080-Pyramimonas_sp.AAC.1